MDYGFEEHLAEVTSRYGETPDPRLRTIMESLTRHLLAFADDVDLTREEWLAGLCRKNNLYRVSFSPFFSSRRILRISAF